MIIFIILAVAIVIAVSVWKERQKNIAASFSNAATALGLHFSTDGTVMRRPWIFGETSGIRVDVRPFTRSQNGTQAIWTGYRITFPYAIDPSIVGENDPKRQLMVRLSNRFSECSISDDELFCARSGLVEDSSRIISDVKYLINAAQDLLGESGAESDTREVAATTPPPPLPPRPKPIVQEVKSDDTEGSEFHTVDLHDTKSDEENAQAVPTTIPEPTKVETPAPSSHENAEGTPETSESETISEDSGVPYDESLPNALGAAARDLFDSGLNRFQIGQTFASDYGDQNLEGNGILRRVDRYSNDRYFGRGPGYLAEVEIRRLENPSGGLSQISAVVQLPDEEESQIGLSEWREKLGERVLVCGTLVHCDAFTGKLFLRNGLVDSPLVSTSA